MATYKEITADIRERTGKTIHHPCWIAHVKDRHGLTKRQAHNRRNPNQRVKPCPEHWITEIEISLIKFGMIQSLDKKN